MQQEGENIMKNTTSSAFNIFRNYVLFLFNLPIVFLYVIASDSGELPLSYRMVFAGLSLSIVLLYINSCRQDIKKMKESIPLKQTNLVKAYTFFLAPVAYYILGILSTFIENLSANKGVVSILDGFVLSIYLIIMLPFMLPFYITQLIEQPILILLIAVYILIPILIYNILKRKMR